MKDILKVLKRKVVGKSKGKSIIVFLFFKPI